MPELIWQRRQWWLDDEHRPEAHVPGGMFRMWSKFPVVFRDLTIPRPKDLRTYDVWAQTIILHSGYYLEQLWFKNEYRPKNTITVCLVFQSFQRTLTKQEVNEAMKNIEQSFSQST